MCWTHNNASKYLKLNNGRSEVSALALLLSWSVNCPNVVRLLVTLRRRSTSATPKERMIRDYANAYDTRYIACYHIAIKISIRATRRIPRKQSSVVIVTCRKTKLLKLLYFEQRGLEITGYTTYSIWLSYSSGEKCLQLLSNWITIVFLF